MTTLEPLQRYEAPAARLMAKHPPMHRNKRAIFDVACPPGSRHNGIIRFSRWATLALPAMVPPLANASFLDIRNGFYGYEPADDLPDAMEWHVNFADPRLFGYYGSQLFA